MAVRPTPGKKFSVGPSTWASIVASGYNLVVSDDWTGVLREASKSRFLIRILR